MVCCLLSLKTVGGEERSNKNIVGQSREKISISEIMGYINQTEANSMIIEKGNFCEKQNAHKSNKIACHMNSNH